MNKKIAIFCPRVGVISETFIKRHTELLSGRMVVVADSAVEGGWSPDCPILFLSNDNTSLIVKFIVKKFKLPFNYDDWRIKRFLRKNSVGYALGEYLEYACKWVNVLNKMKIPYYVHSYGYDISENLRNEKWIRAYKILNNTEGVINEGTFVEPRLIKLGIEKSKIHFITTCPEVPPTFQSRSNNAIVRLIASGRMVGKKSPILTLASYMKALETVPNMHLDYIGGGEMLGAAIDFVRAFNLQEKVTFHGAQPNNVVVDFMNKADIFICHNVVDVVSGDEEGLPVTFLEAMGAGVPVISTYHAGIPDCITDGENGLLVQEGDVKGMAENIVKLASDYHFRQNMAKKAWERTLNEFSWVVERQKLLELMKVEI